MKSALIINTPTNCIDCPLQADDKACGITETSFISIRANEEILEHWSDYCPNCGCRMVEPQERNGEEV